MRFIFSIIILITFASCGKKLLPSAQNPPTPTGGTYSYLALGDSYTIGQSVKMSERFPAQTVARLRAQGVSIADPVYIATTGWTTANLQSAIASQHPPANFDVVTLLIGVNDQYQRMDTAGYAQRFEQLVQKSVELAGGRKSRVFVVSIPDYSVTPFVPAGDKARVSREVDLFNEINRRITGAYGISYTDITPGSREGANNPSLIADDNLHPSGQEYAKWAALLAPKIRSVLP